MLTQDLEVRRSWLFNYWFRPQILGASVVFQCSCHGLAVGNRQKYMVENTCTLHIWYNTNAYISDGYKIQAYNVLYKCRKLSYDKIHIDAMNNTKDLTMGSWWYWTYGIYSMWAMIYIDMMIMCRWLSSIGEVSKITHMCRTVIYNVVCTVMGACVNSITRPG